MVICQCVINGFVLIDLHVSHYADTPHTYLDTIIYMPFLTSYINICSSTVFYQQDWAINSKWWYGGSQGLIWLSQKSWWRFTDSIIKFNTTNITTTTTTLLNFCGLVHSRQVLALLQFFNNTLMLPHIFCSNPVPSNVGSYLAWISFTSLLPRKQKLILAVLMLSISIARIRSYWVDLGGLHRI